MKTIPADKKNYARVKLSQEDLDSLPEPVLSILRLSSETNTPRDGKWHDVSNTNGMQAIMGKECEIVLERRNDYCDRGNFLAKIFPFGNLGREMDDQDGWPRYYFDEQRAKAEIEAWLVKRKQKL